MHHARRLRRRGSVTTMWVAALPVFMIFFMFLGSLVIAWIEHGVAQKAADAGGLAATKKLDEVTGQQLQAQISQLTGATFNPVEAIIGTPELKQLFIKGVISSHEEAIKKEVRKYVEKNGAKPSKIIFFENGRVVVEAKIKYQPMVFQDQFKEVYVRGEGFGPVRDYGKWWQQEKNPYVIEF